MARQISTAKLDGYWVANILSADGRLFSGVGITKNSAIANALHKM